MNDEIATLRRRLYASALIVLVLGLGSALLIYLDAGKVSDALQGSQVVIIEGKAYPIAQSDTKAYLHDVERFGGKAALLFTEFDDWFARLWRGRQLGITLAWLSVIVSLGLYLLASRLWRAAPPDAADDADRPEPG